MELSNDQKNAITNVQNFLDDADAFDAYITGQAGTGKTTVLNEIVAMCLKAHIPTVVCAFTHKAAGVLREKLPEEADIRTLHSFLKKRPGINENAKSIKALQTTTQFGQPEPIKLLIVDEYSMVGESDAMSIGELQDPEYEGIPQMKVLYVGDYRQLDAIKGTSPISDNVKRLRKAANGKKSLEYYYELTEVQRQGAGPLLDTICEIVDMIDGKSELHKLEPNEEFHRDVDIIAEHNPYEDSIILAYTNKRVEELNLIAFNKLKGSADETNERWSPTLRAELVYHGDTTNPSEVLTHSGPLVLDSKYKTLEHLHTMPDIQFGRFTIEGETKTIAYVFGHYQYKLKMEELAQIAAESNNSIDHHSPAAYCKQNPHSKECRKRAKAWRDYLTFKECVMCVDYPYAQTIHKSQGSTFEKVYIDNEDLKMLLVKGQIEMYLKLLYVGVSRASDKVYLS